MVVWSKLSGNWSSTAIKRDRNEFFSLECDHFERLNMTNMWKENWKFTSDIIESIVSTTEQRNNTQPPIVQPWIFQMQRAKWRKISSYCYVLGEIMVCGLDGVCVCVCYTQQMCWGFSHLVHFPVFIVLNYTSTQSINHWHRNQICRSIWKSNKNQQLFPLMLLNDMEKRSWRQIKINFFVFRCVTFYISFQSVDFIHKNYPKFK